MIITTFYSHVSPNNYKNLQYRYVFDKAMALPEGPKKIAPSVKFWREEGATLDEEPERKVIKSGGH